MINKIKLIKILHILALAFLCACFLFPIYWMLITSFKSEQDIILWPPKMWPANFTFENYTSVMAHPEDTPILRWFFNSVIVPSEAIIWQSALQWLGGLLTLVISCSFVEALLESSL